jgi:nucleoside-diphosphate-sugar epimerase
MDVKMNKQSIVTIIGATGFLGSHLVTLFSQHGYQVNEPSRKELCSLSGNLGIIIYAAGYGVCKDAAAKEMVVEANITVLSNLLTKCSFSRLIYLSSTRLYMGGSNSTESTNLGVLNTDDRKLFNLSKLIGEELCLAYPNTYVVRPSNIYGVALSSNLFLPSIVRNSISAGRIDMYISPSYSKDYISVDDVCFLIKSLAIKNQPVHRIYNLGSGVNISSKKIADVIQSHTDCDVNWHDSPEDDYFPVTDVSRAKKEFNFEPSNILDDLVVMIQEFKLAKKDGLF